MNGATVAAVKHKRKKYLRAFEKAGAIETEKCKTLQELGLHDSLIFRKMLRQGIFVECEKKKYYLNLSVAKMYEETRRYFLRLILLILFLVVLAIVLGRLLI